jgi:hypothetical protein
MEQSIYRNDNESNKIYNYRKDFILSNYEELNKSGCDLQCIIKYSKILANIKFKNCKYDQSIHTKLKDYILPL